MKTDAEPVKQALPEGIPSGKDYYERSLTVALLRARESTMRRFKKYADAHNLSLPQWRVLRALADGEALDAGTLCQRCVILPPSLTRILRAMGERGLIQGVSCSDARRHMVTLTPGTTSLSVSADGRTLYVHCLDAPDPEAAVAEMKRALERPVGEILP